MKRLVKIDSCLHLASACAQTEPTLLFLKFDLCLPTALGCLVESGDFGTSRLLGGSTPGTAPGDMEY
jgi:hypothetical protein